MPDQTPPPRWMRHTLIAAGVYNFLWGACVVAFPNALFNLLDMQPPIYPQIWQCVGMIVGVYGVGYFIAAVDPMRHWPIVLVGLLGKVFGPIGFAFSVAGGDFPPAFGWTLLTNDLLWWLPFTAILFQACRSATSPDPATHLAFDEAVRTIVSDQGQTLAELSSKQPLLVVLPRHAGCTFCRTSLADLGKQRAAMEARGLRLALVHMSESEKAERMFNRLGLQGVPHFVDPERQLYRAFELTRGTFAQLMRWNVLWRGAQAAFLGGHGFGPIQGDGFQLAGAFVLKNGKIVSAQRQQDAAEQPDFLALTACVLEESSVE